MVGLDRAMVGVNKVMVGYNSPSVGLDKQSVGLDSRCVGQAKGRLKAKKGNNNPPWGCICITNIFFYSMETNDFIPRAESEQLVWLGNFKTNLVIQGSAVGLTAPQITALTGSCDNIITTVGTAATKRTAFNEAVSTKVTVKNTELKSIRVAVNRMKTHAGYTPAIGKSLQIIGTSLDLDIQNYKPEITAEPFAGYIRIKFVKRGVDGINIYHRKKGEGNWNFLARDTKSPYDDHIELATEGQPEHWEYRAFGVIDDSEIGQPSKIIEIVFGG